ncbi:uncharacterized protein BX664DRAFT_385488 [Halteromyces radiatus]|uniref:uncharacterized protein n=1 Tax=Halteromyces radiatus TaxID=101107 RepID=UPI00221EBD60|nr:uncharacterized protein BX664DRAFT_385488 [Halteromyces radiatus]KAI8088904.1 hypothetical protein BX664DRAFT_385488 [Halteromyces radiatus]
MSFATFPSSLPFFASLHDQSLLDQEIDALSAQVNKEQKKTKTRDSQAFMDALQQVEKLTVTTNGAVAHSTSSDPCLDLYASMVGKDCSSDALAAAYDKDPDTTLKLIFHCRSIHDGKMNKMGFYTAFLWLLKHHPKTALCNMDVLVKGTIPNRPVEDKNNDKDDDWEVVDKDEKAIYYKSHGYWKDLLNILCIYTTEGVDGKEFTALNHPRQEYDPEHHRARRKARRAFCASLEGLPQEEVDRLRKERVDASKERQNMEKQAQMEKRRRVRQERNDKVVRLLTEDPLYRALHFTVARLFAAQLKLDQQTVLAYEKNESKDDDRYALANKISLAGKWAPSLGCSHDKYTMIVTSIAEILFLPSANGDDEDRTYHLNEARDQYRRHITSVLRKAMDVTERRMALNEWNKINFSHVPSLCMQRNSKHFLKHVPNEYQAFLQGVANGTRKVSGAVLGPHDFVERARALNKGNQDEETIKAERLLLDGQWKTYIRAIQEACGPEHALRSSLAICDTSGSMTYGQNSVEPLNAAIGLSLTLMALAAQPFAGTMISFSEHPSIISIDTTLSFADQVEKVLASEWGMSTNLYAVFVDLLLPMAKKFNLKQEDMVKRLFVFTDMQFNNVTPSVDDDDGQFDTLWETVVKEYEKAGYVPPEIVWWNLNALGNSELTLQATKDSKGVAMVAGFSQNMLKNFMDGDEVASEIVPPSRWELQEQEDRIKSQLSPLEVMMKDIGKDSFSSLVVFD